MKIWGVKEKGEEKRKTILPAFNKMVVIIKYNKECYSIKNIIKVLISLVLLEKFKMLSKGITNQNHELHKDNI